MLNNIFLVPLHCKNKKKHMNKEINSNRFDYVDLGLPSGTKWATCNVGANKPSESGLYFAWGEIQGYTADQVGKDKQFNWANYKWNPSGDGKTFTKYTTKNATLELEDDAAHANMGGDWHMPSPRQCKELIDNTTSELSNMYGVGGMKFISKKDKSKFIFFPLIGYAINSSIHNSGRYGYIFASTLKRNGYGRVFSFGLGYPYSGNKGLRYYGFSVRGVIGY